MFLARIGEIQLWMLIWVEMIYVFLGLAAPGPTSLRFVLCLHNSRYQKDLQDMGLILFCSSYRFLATQLNFQDSSQGSRVVPESRRFLPPPPLEWFYLCRILGDQLMLRMLEASSRCWSLTWVRMAYLRFQAWSSSLKSLRISTIFTRFFLALGWLG